MTADYVGRYALRVDALGNIVGEYEEDQVVGIGREVHDIVRHYMEQHGLGDRLDAQKDARDYAKAFDICMADPEHAAAFKRYAES